MGSRYACQPRNRAPANRLMPPTGAKFHGCGTSRATAPATVNASASGLRFAFSMRLSSSWIVALPGSRAIRFPQNFGYSQSMTRPAAPDKQGVAEPVQIPDDLTVNMLFPRERHRDPFGAPADGSAHMQLGIKPAASRQHERAQRGQDSVHPVDLAFQLCDFSVCDARLPRMNVLGQRRQNRADVE